MATAYYFILPYAETDDGTTMLLAKRHLIQRLIKGQKFNTSKGVWPLIPEWAGQWVVIGGAGLDSESGEEATRRLFREQTGVNLADGQTADYGIVEQQLKLFTDDNYDNFIVLYLKLTGSGIQTLAANATQNIDDRSVYDGVLEMVDVEFGPLALQKIGPIKPPADGWRAFLVQNYFGGQQPGMLNTTIDTLEMQIKKNSTQDATWFKTAIEAVPIEAVPEEDADEEDDTGGVEIKSKVTEKKFPAPDWLKLQ